MKLSQNKRAKLKKQIQVAASLTPHQAGKVAGVVLNIVGIQNISDDMFAEDTDSKEVIRSEKQDDYVPRVYGPKGPQPKRRPEDCTKSHDSIGKCTGVLCSGCPDFVPTEARIDEIHTFASRLNTSESLEIVHNTPECKCKHVETTDIRKDGANHYHVLCNGFIASTEEPPFELDEDIGEIYIKPGSIIITPEEFKLIKASLLGSMSSSVNDSINKLQKKMDKDEEKQAIIENILVVLKLKNKLDKL